MKAFSFFRWLFHRAPELDLVPDALVGFVDIIGSTSLCNAVDLQTGYEIKRQFYAAASRRARQFQMILLNHTGDGFLFVADPRKGEGWTKTLIPYFDLLAEDYRAIVAPFEEAHRLTGLRFGASLGPVIIGMLAASHSETYTAIGPDVNLAARLCAMANGDDIVLTGRVWRKIEPHMQDLTDRGVERHKYTTLKGFDREIEATHLKTKRVPEKALLEVGFSMGAA